ncbi:hypothetical protein C8Q76DRAFT_719692 [Earliella scabrosa]|nr:hypothetical protein C8Q76DRAFT_719692 [Earliella scabrosa]
MSVILSGPAGYSRNRPQVPSQGGCDVSVPMTYAAAVDVGTVCAVCHPASSEPTPDPHQPVAIRPPSSVRGSIALDRRTCTICMTAFSVLTISLSRPSTPNSNRLAWSA